MTGPQLMYSTMKSWKLSLEDQEQDKDAHLATFIQQSIESPSHNN